MKESSGSVVENTYLQLRLREVEDALHHDTLKSLRHMTRDMTPEELADFTQTPIYRQRQFQFSRKSELLQALIHSDLNHPLLKGEFQSLKPLIQSELDDNQPVDLTFLRSVRRYHYRLPEARLVRRVIQEKRTEMFWQKTRSGRIEALSKALDNLLTSMPLPEMAGHTDPDYWLKNELSVADVLLKEQIPCPPDAAFLRSALKGESLEHMLLRQIIRVFPELKRFEHLVMDGIPCLQTVRQASTKEADEHIRLLGSIYSSKHMGELLNRNPALSQTLNQVSQIRLEHQHLKRALLEALPEHYPDLYPLAREMHRKFILHLGPTNSGKTFESMERLKSARRGIYLGPLRLLAFEQFENLNLQDIPCSLVTGEETIRISNSRVQASTVEMADLTRYYDIAVLDEGQMVADPERGGAWTDVILGLCAEEIHVCASEDAESLLTGMILACGDSLETRMHSRMTPLQMDPFAFQFPKDVRSGDALIVFSKLHVHAVASELRALGYKVSLIYGALPPDVRRDQSERFRQGITDVLVSTDAIAMGMNLPIRRIVFLENEKFDGDIVRSLTVSEIKQIAGRAGRFGQYDIGYVTALGFKNTISYALQTKLRPLSEAVIRFPESLLGVSLPLSSILEAWENMQVKPGFSKASAERMLKLAIPLEKKDTDKKLLYRFLCIPFDETNPRLYELWHTMYRCECTGESFPITESMPGMVDPDSCNTQDLDSLEEDYEVCDLLYNYARLFLDHPEPLLDEIQRRKDLISSGIIQVLTRRRLLTRTCRKCGKMLSWNWPHSTCETCHQRQRW